MSEWALRNNITHTALNELLNWLKVENNMDESPIDARTLLGTPRQTEIRKMGSGSFYYFGLSEELVKINLRYESDNTTTMFFSYVLSFNIDGLPLHKSSKLSFWPILCRVTNYYDEPPFLVALYCGTDKPPLNDFFSEFICECKQLSENPLTAQNKIINISFGSFCCDTPARAFIKGTKAHNSYRGCDKCEAKGVYCNRRMTFLSINSTLRNDVDFCNLKYGDYHKVVSPLCELNIGMVSGFPIDYMHSVCLGVMRKLLFLWRNGSRLVRIPVQKLLVLENRLKILKTYWPIEFNRKPRSFNELEHWKATEYRQFLLYVVPLLEDILAPHIFAHVNLLKFALTILLNKELNAKYNDYANELLKLFVSQSAKIFVLS